MTCNHDQRFHGVLLLLPQDQGCLACAFQRENKRAERAVKLLNEFNAMSLDATYTEIGQWFDKMHMLLDEEKK